MNQKKIAFYIGSLSKGGAERVFVNLAEFFLQEGYEVTMITQYQKEDEYKFASGIKRVVSDITEQETSSNRIINFYRRFAKLRHIFKAEKADLVLSTIGKNNFLAIATNFFLPTKVVVSVVAEPKEEYPGKLMQLCMKFLFPFADGLVLQTTDSMSFFPKRILKKATILQNSLNPQFMLERFTGERRKEIVSVGRLDDNKNHRMLMEAFIDVADDYPDYELNIYGEGESRNKLETIIANSNYQDRIHLPGKTENVVGAIYESRLFVLTSYSEGMPNALIEAMALGLPVISTNCPCGGPKDLITEGENGLLIPVGDKEALVKAMHTILSDETFAEKLGQNAAKLQQRLDPKRTNQLWMDYFESIMNV